MRGPDKEEGSGGLISDLLKLVCFAAIRRDRSLMGDRRWTCSSSSELDTPDNGRRPWCQSDSAPIDTEHRQVSTQLQDALT